MRLFGLGALGLADTQTLQAGTVINFVAHSSMCSLVSNQDLATDLNNWLSQMMSIASVQNTWEGVLPTVVDKEVTAVVTNDILAGELRGQIIAALSAMTQCQGLVLKDGVINVASGGTNPGLPPTPTSDIPWGVITGAAALVLVVVLTRR